MADIEDSDWKVRDANSYDAVADNFNRLTDRVSVYAAEELANALPTNAKNVLDIGCGTGIVMLSIARRLPKTSRITGLDLSPVMLATARCNAENNGHADRFSFVVGDAEALAMEDCSVDAATSLYAWRHLPHPTKVTAEIFRVLKPGGTFAVAVGSAPSLTSPAGILSAFGRVIGKIEEARGRQLVACQQIDALVDHYLPSAEATEEAGWTKEHHGFAGSLRSLVEGAGFKDGQARWLGKTFIFDSADEFWNLQTTFSSTARKRIADASPEVVSMIRAAFMDQCNAVLERGGKLTYRVGAAFVVAVKPVT